MAIIDWSLKQLMYGQIDLIKLILPIFKIKNGSIKFDLSSQEILSIFYHW